MATILTLLAIIFTIAALAAPIVFLQTRKTFREQKNYERGLKMVPLFIHLPPPSDDTEVGSRDVRDVTDETISMVSGILLLKLLAARASCISMLPCQLCLSKWSSRQC
jgi:hypothetical protein